MITTINTFINFPDWVLEKWQDIADLLAETLNIPAALIMKTENESMEVFISSRSEHNPYPVGAKEVWHGLYCETVIKTQNKLLVPNATKDKIWDTNPGLKLGMVAYLGFPLNFPDNQPFGTLCVLDNKERSFTLLNEKLIQQFKHVIELDLALLQSFEFNTRPLSANVFEEITERRQAENNIKKLNRVYTVFSKINQAIIRTHDKQELFDKVCRIAVDDSKYLMAWIGIVNPATNKVDVVASAGKTGEYLKDINIDLNDLTQSSGPTGRAIKSGKSVFSNNIETDVKMIPWRKNALKQGYRSSITEPISVYGEIIGAYTMYSGENGFFNEEEIKLLDRMASNISFALEFIESEKKRKQAEEELKENNQRLIDAQAVAKVGSWETDLSNMVVKWSLETFRIFELDPQGFCTTHPNFLEFVHPEDRAKVDEAFVTSLSTHSLNTIQHRILTPTGIVKFVEENWRIIFNEQGLATRAFGTCSDITERKRADEKIREKDIQFRKLSANVSDLIFQFTRNPDGTYCVPIASDGIRNIFGCSPENVIDDFTPIARVIYPDDAARVFAEIEYSAEHLTFFTCEFRVRIPGREVQWIFSRSSPEKLPDGSITWYGFNADITERKQAEEELKHLSARLSLALRAGGVGIWEYDIVKNTLLWDDQMFALYGVNKNDFGGVYEAWRSGLHPEDKARGDAEIQMAIDGEKEFDTGFRVVWPDGSIHSIRAIGIVLRNDTGQPIRMIGTNWDITDQKNAEMVLTLAKEQAQESDRLKSAFLANMSHEIRTPMNGILGFAELLKEPNLTGEDQQKYIHIIEKSGARMLNIINDIVDISKIEAGLMKVEISESNINDQIEYIYAFFKPEVDAKGLKLFFRNSLPAKEAIIHTDREKLYVILTNLVKNAIKYTPAGSIEFGYDIVSGVQGHAPLIQCYVKDTGIGIPNDRQAAIFERFIQAEISDKMARQGAGLGLSISKAYVEMLGGKIWVESEESIGSTFYFTLPFIVEPVENKGVHINVPAPDEKNQVKKLKILIAEDDETSEILITIDVNKFSKEILKARNGFEAVELCRNNPDTDLILMDILMPVMNGYESTRQIRQFNKDVVIIAQTAFGLSGDKEKAIEAGCNDYISKPINRNELLSLIQKYFKK